MSLQHLKLEGISEAELARLVVDGIGESKTLEFKQALELATDEQKRELLSDITALANTDGGDLVLGMKADKGIAVDLVGLKNFTPDDAVGRIENLLRDFVQPRLAGVHFRPLALANGNHALVIRVPRSFASPHMIRHQGVTRFCGRNANGKYDLDVHELRSAFLASETLSERLKAFRIERINRLLSGNTPVPLAGEHFMVLHIFPVIGARADSRVATTDLQRLIHDNLLNPIAGGGYDPRFNFDGLLVAAQFREENFRSYVQVFRNGFLEAVESRTLAPKANQLDGAKLIPSIAWEERIIQVVPGYLKALNQLRIAPPFVISVSLLNVRGFYMHVGRNVRNDEVQFVDRDHLLTDEILVESPDAPAAQIMRPLFDQVWNGCGWHGSINYDKEGNWREHG